MEIYSNSFRGFSHKRSGKPCQDSTLSYRDAERAIIACCDGHGGAAYIRSQRGSRFACEAILEVFRALSPADLHQGGEEAEKRIRMELLCAWNRRVEEDYAAHPLRHRELARLDEETAEELLMNKAKAYGTTMSGAMVLGNTLVLASIGDSECLLVGKGEIERPLSHDGDPVGNVTYSLCQDNAFDYIRVRILDFREYDAVLLCTDGFAGPFQSYENLRTSFVNPMLLDHAEGKSLAYVEQLVSDLAAQRGTGDDVSLAYIIKGKIQPKHYRKEE